MVIVAITCFPLVGCAGGAAVMNKAPQEVWTRFSSGASQDLIVVFDDAAILAQAAQRNKEKGIVSDDNDTLRFKKERYATIKTEVLSATPSGKVVILKNYDILPLMLVRIDSAEALKELLAHPAVVRVHDDRKENMLR
jgi:hypothetical protein